MPGLVFSDLHLFSPRSCAEDYLELLHEELQSSEVAVLNGDIFDFRWSRHSDHQATLDAATDWLTTLCQTHPHCQFHYILGNHDCLTFFVAALDELASIHPNFQWHEMSLHLGRNLFLHGDCTHRKMTPESFARYREAWSDHGQNPASLMPIYQLLDRVGFTHLLHKILFRPQPTLDRLTYFLDQSLPDWRKETDHCFFGHTHGAFTGRKDGEVRFSNTGCAIRGIEFLPLRFSLDGLEEPISIPKSAH